MHELFTRPEWSTVITSTNKPRLYWFKDQICINVYIAVFALSCSPMSWLKITLSPEGLFPRLVLASLSHIWLFLIPPSSDFEKVFTYCIATIICLFVRKYESIQSKYHLNMIASDIANDICTCHWRNPGGGRYNGKQTDRTCSKAAVQNTSSVF